MKDRRKLFRLSFLDIASLQSFQFFFLLTIPATPFSVLTSSYRSSLSYSSPSVLQPYRLIRYLGVSFLSAVPNCESEICIDLKNRRRGWFHLPPTGICRRRGSFLHLQCYGRETRVVI